MTARAGEPPAGGLWRRLRFCAGYFVFWTGYFELLRAVFLLYHHREAARAGTAAVLGAMFHGARMDMTAAAFPSAIVFVLVLLSLVAPRLAARAVIVVTIPALVFFALLGCIDMEIFRAWGFHVDAAILQYLKTPREMMASAASSPVALLGVLFVALSAIAVVAFMRLFGPALRCWTRLTLLEAIGGVPAVAFVTALLAIPARGGLQRMPITQSTVYFSHDDFANQAAINFAWNFFDSVWWGTYRTDFHYRVMPPAVARSVADSLLASGAMPARSLLRLPRPDVILILWESFTAKVVARLGGVPGVTPNIDSLTHQGILFTRFYATGDRSPEGITGVLAGYPAQPTTEIIQHPRKSVTLPALPHDLARAGYRSTFYYGGDPDFSNIKSFVLEAGFDSLVTRDAFPRSEQHSSWGADDDVVLSRLLGDVPGFHRPFFAMLFTLSSHEPFKVPMAPVFPGSDERDEFLNAHAYTDRSIGAFIRAAKRQPWWDSTLIIITADHGHRLPVLDSLQTARKWETFSIPMLWLGGALAVRDTVIDAVGSQTDIPRTVLDQLGLDDSAYHWSRDLFARDVRPWAFFTFTDGFGWVNGAGDALAWDNPGGRAIATKGNIGAADIRAGRALLQTLMADYVKR